MRYLLDTCVISDGAKPHKFAAVARWLESQATQDLVISALTVGELRFGIQRLPAGKKRERVKHWMEAQLLPAFSDRILPVDSAIADTWGLLRASGEDMGRSLPIVDGLLLATARVHGLTFVTRNLADVDDRGVSVL